MKTYRIQWRSPRNIVKNDEVIVRDITVNFVKTTGGWKITKVSFDPDDADGCSASAG